MVVGPRQVGALGSCASCPAAGPGLLLHMHKRSVICTLMKFRYNASKIQSIKLSSFAIQKKKKIIQSENFNMVLQ